MSQIKLHAYPIREQGTRDEQQDRIHYVKFTPLHRFVVIDGMGGTQAGGPAAQRLMKWLSAEGDLEQIVSSAHSNFQQWLIERFEGLDNSELPGAVATILELNVKTRQAKVCHLGDTRLYLRRSKDEEADFVQITEDQVSAEGKVMQDFGLEKIQPLFYTFELHGEEEIFVCTDGLYEVLDENTAYELGLYFALPTPQEIAETMVREKLHLFEDNASGYCIRLERVEPKVVVVPAAKNSTFWLPVVGAALAFGIVMGLILDQCAVSSTSPDIDINVNTEVAPVDPQP